MHQADNKSSLGFSQRTTCLGTLAAGFRAALAVVMVVRRTFLGTQVAGIGAQAAQLGVQIRTPRQKTRAQRAQVGAVAVEPNALDHHPHHFSFQTGGRAELTGTRAGFTRFNTGLGWFRKLKHHGAPCSLII